MKILFLTPWYPDQKNPNHGIFIQDQAIALSKFYQVYLISSKVDYERFGIFSQTKTVQVSNNLIEERLTIKQSLPVFNQINFFWCTVYESYKVCRKFKPDVIHSNIGYPGAFWGWCLSLFTKKPWILSEHTLLNNNFRSPVHRWFTVKYLTKANAVTTVSHFSAKIIQEITGKKAFVIPNIIRFDLFTENQIPKKAEVHIGFLGSKFFAKKGLKVLLSALSRAEGNFILHIGGNDADLSNYQKHAESLGINHKCMWHGEVLRNQVPTFMNQIDFFVNTSLFESFGMAIAEAMACGLPVVCTSNGGPADFVNDTNGLLVPAENEAELSKALSQMIKNCKEYDPEKIKNQVRIRFSESTFCNSILEVYNSAIQDQN